MSISFEPASFRHRHSQNQLSTNFSSKKFFFTIKYRAGKQKKKKKARTIIKEWKSKSKPTSVGMYDVTLYGLMSTTVPILPTLNNSACFGGVNDPQVARWH